MKIVEFQSVKRGEVFYDYAYSGEWLQKLDFESARFEDGLVALFSPANKVKLPTAVSDVPA